MNRLTEKVKGENSYNIDVDYNSKLADDYDLINGADSIESVVSKLGQIEDAEEKIGFDFITIFKAFENGIRILDDGSSYTDWVVLIYSSGIPCGFKGRVSDHCVYFKDYGKTWTLKEEI